MNFNDLEYFIAVSELKSFTKAAESLHITQPTLTVAVNRLEKELGTDLFVRNKKKKDLSQTFAGEIFYRRAKEILINIENVKLEMRSFSETKIHFGLPQILGAYFFPPIFLEIIKKYPHVKFDIKEEGSLKIIDSISKGELDLGVITIFDPSLLTNVNCVKIAEDEIFLSVSKKHRWGNLKEVNLKDAENEKFILLNKNFSHSAVAMSSFKELNISPEIFITSENIQTIKYMVASNIGVSLIMGMALSLSKDDITALKIKDSNLKLGIYICYNKNIKLSNATQTVLDFVINYLKEAKVDTKNYLV